MPIALQYNIGIFEYWDYTLAEIQMLIEAYKKKEEKESKDTIQLVYLQSTMVAQFIGKVINGKKIPSLNSVFPGMFPEASNDWKKYEEQFLTFAKQHNKNREVDK